jgi:hypothetical protein
VTHEKGIFQILNLRSSTTSFLSQGHLPATLQIDCNKKESRIKTFIKGKSRIWRSELLLKSLVKWDVLQRLRIRMLSSALVDPKTSTGIFFLYVWVGWMVVDDLVCLRLSWGM